MVVHNKDRNHFNITTKLPNNKQLKIKLNSNEPMQLEWQKINQNESSFIMLMTFIHLQLKRQKLR